MDIVPFKNLIREKTGLTFEGERHKTLEKAIFSRMAASQRRFHTEYFHHLFSDQEEFSCLIDLLAINETYFFREPGHFKLLIERLVPESRKRKNKGDKIKILSAGSATGEEPYSIAITLMEKYGRDILDIFYILAVDIDRDAVMSAKNGVFGKKSFRKSDETLKKKYFTEIGDNRFEIKDFVKEAVQFENLNLLGNGFSQRHRELDVIFYRNVSIYFQPETQRSIFQKFSQLLSDEGYLLVGSVETFSHDLGILSLLEMEGFFLYRKKRCMDVDERRTRAKKNSPQPCSKKRDVPVHSDAGPLPVSFVDKRKERSALFDEALALAQNKNYEKALSAVNALLDSHPDFIKARSLKASILINLKRMEEAAGTCRHIIEKDQWHLEGYLIMGVIHRILGNDPEALKRFKEALYIDPSCWLAHFYLADIYSSQGERERACREYGITINLLRKGDLSGHGLTYFPLSFPAEQVMHLCRHNLEKLSSREVT